MNIKDYSDKVHNLIRNLKREIDFEERDGIVVKNKEFSDIIDDKNFQYVDIVMEGGGVLGIALVGFTYVLEQVGIRFLQIGGTSAGAINALMLASLGTPAEAKSEKILQELVDVNLYKFVDGDRDSRSVIKYWLENGDRIFSEEEDYGGSFLTKLMNDIVKLSFYSRLTGIRDNIRDDLGLNPGEKFRRWVQQILEKEKIYTTRDLLDRMSKLPTGLTLRNGKEVDVKPMLALVAADISTQTKVIFPDMAKLYWENYDKINPSYYVRASMSIPFFFSPMWIKKIPRTKEIIEAWGDCGFDEAPESCIFIDGGIISNFPIHLFHRADRVPPSPTFGVKLGFEKKKSSKITSPISLLSGIFNAARFNLDRDFISRNSDYHKLISYIDTGSHNWLNFKMSDGDKLDLFWRGAEEACKFLKNFDWQDYKELRKRLAIPFSHESTLEDKKFGEAVLLATKSSNICGDITEKKTIPKADG